MKPLSVQEILPIEVYELQRSAVRKRATTLRELRRFELADSCVVVFENRTTVQYQVQEMLRVEKEVSPDRIALELSCFNLLIPGTNELSATLLIRVPEYREVDNLLQRLNGITHECISLVVNGEPVYATFDVDEETLICDSDVFYIRFSMTSEQTAAFIDEKLPVSLRASHEKCNAEIPIASVVRQSLVEDLQS
jgi:hypothetical protein